MHVYVYIKSNIYFSRGKSIKLELGICLLKTSVDRKCHFFFVFAIVPVSLKFKRSVFANELCKSVADTGWKLISGSIAFPFKWQPL